MLNILFWLTQPLSPNVTNLWDALYCFWSGLHRTDTLIQTYHTQTALHRTVITNCHVNQRRINVSDKVSALLHHMIHKNFVLNSTEEWDSPNGLLDILNEVFHSIPSIFLFSWTFLKAYSKAKLTRNVDKASHCFRRPWIRNVSRKCLSARS
jgi:hypothetical protein